MRLIPIRDKVVDQRTDAEETTSGGIVLPDTAREKPAEGRMLSIGDGSTLADGKRVVLQVSEGDRGLFSSYAGAEVVIDGEELIVMSESDILAVIS